MTILKRVLNIYSVCLLGAWIGLIYFLPSLEPLREKLFMAVTMAFASFIAGATSEGGGAVAFPIMTLIFKVKPDVARDFSLFIQSCGMIAASFAIYKNKIKVNWNIITFACLGAVFGNMIGFKYVVPNISPVFVKLLFCSLWMSFVLVLFMTKMKKSKSDEKDVHLGSYSRLIFIPVGLLGGIVTSLVGTGVDIITFAVATLYFKQSLKIATPTSVVIMAINSVTCLILKDKIFTPISYEAFQYTLVALPVVIFGAPLGAIFISNRGKNFLLVLLCFSIIAQYVLALVILPIGTFEIIYSLAIVLLGSLLWLFLDLFSTATKEKGPRVAEADSQYNL